MGYFFNRLPIACRKAEKRVGLSRELILVRDHFMAPLAEDMNLYQMCIPLLNADMSCT